MNVTLSLPEDIVGRAEMLAERTGRQATEVMEDMITTALKSVGTLSWRRKPWAECTDDEVLAAWNIQMTAESDRRFSELLDRQQSAHLSDGERNEMTALLEQYQDGLLIKAEALEEGVRRGLLPRGSM